MYRCVSACTARAGQRIAEGGKRQRRNIMSSYSLWAWAELEQVCTAESVAARNSRTLDILWRYFYLPKRTREHAARFLERIDRRLFNAASSTTVGQQAAAGINMLLAPAAKSSNLHDPVFPLLLQEFTSHAGGTGT